VLISACKNVCFFFGPVQEKEMASRRPRKRPARYDDEEEASAADTPAAPPPPRKKRQRVDKTAQYASAVEQATKAAELEAAAEEQAARIAQRGADIANIPTREKRGPGRPPLTVTKEAATMLKKLFYDDKMFMGRDRLYKYIQQEHPDIVQSGKLSRRMVQLWLDQQESYSVHRRWVADKTISRRLTKQPFNVIVFDLKDMSRQAWPPNVPDKDKFHWIMAAQDAFSKKLWAEPMKNKEVKADGAETLRAAKAILDRMLPHVPKTIAVDNGSEWIAAKFKQLCAERGIKLVFGLPRKPQSQGQVERANGTINRMLSLYLTSTGKSDWPVVLQQLVDNYNKTIHSVTQRTPDSVVADWAADDEEATDAVQTRIRDKALRGANANNLNRIQKQLFKPGEWVRVRLELGLKGGFSWSYKRFKVLKSFQSKYGPGFKATTYELEDEEGNKIEGRWQNDQLSKWVQPTRLAATRDEILVRYILRPMEYKKQTNGVWNYAPGYVCKELVSTVGDKGIIVLKRSDLDEGVPKLLRWFEEKHNVKWTEKLVAGRLRYDFTWTKNAQG
jgi:transposase InsO family protein